MPHPTQGRGCPFSKDGRVTCRRILSNIIFSYLTTMRLKHVELYKNYTKDWLFKMTTSNVLHHEQNKEKNQ
uniref:Ovule protein n=1 Tax=Romanomermis culicivorax TaxID=13658 RepID=A0A915KHZ0_ROMCU